MIDIFSVKKYLILNIKEVKISKRIFALSNRLPAMKLIGINEKIKLIIKFFDKTLEKVKGIYI